MLLYISRVFSQKVFKKGIRNKGIVLIVQYVCLTESVMKSQFTFEHFWFPSLSMSAIDNGNYWLLILTIPKDWALVLNKMLYFRSA